MHLGNYVPVFVLLPQAWRERYGVQAAWGQTRAGYTQLKDDQNRPVNEIKNSGKDYRKHGNLWIEEFCVSHS